MKNWIYILWTAVFTFVHHLAWAVEGEEGPPPDSGFMQTLIMVGIALMFFYVIMWRPEQKRRQAMEEQRNALKKGDRVVAMGIVGNVVRTQDQTVILKMYDGSKIEVLKAAITDIMPDSGEEAKKIDDKEEDKK